MFAIIEECLGGCAPPLKEEGEGTALEYRIGEFSKITGISADTIKHYERKEIIRPHFQEENGYRSYQDSDAVNYTIIRMLRGLDLSVPQIARIHQDSDTHQMDAYLAQKEQELEAQVRQAAQLLDKVRYVRSSFQRIRRELGACVIREIPAIYRLRKSREDRLLDSPQIREATRQLMDALPYSYFSIRVPLESFFGEGDLQYNWGLAITVDDFEMLGLDRQEIYDYSPRRKIASTIVIKDRVLPLVRGDLQHLRDYMGQEHLTAAGEVMVRLLTSTYPQGKAQYYYSVIVPLAESSAFITKQ